MKIAVRGSPSICVLGLPSDIIAGSIEDDVVEVFCIPVAHRKDGLLLAIPHSIIRDEVLEAGNSSAAGESLVGPNKLMSSKLEVEETDGSISTLEDICGFLLVDFTNEVVAHMQPFDPLFEDYSHVVPFFESITHAFPSMVGIREKIRERTQETEAPRAVFYSAREEPEGGKAATGAKKAASKRVTNVSLMEEVENLKMQIAMMKSMQEGKAAPSTVTRAEGALGDAKLLAPKMPGLSAGLVGPPPPMSKAASLLIPPPKTRAPLFQVHSGQRLIW